MRSVPSIPLSLTPQNDKGCELKKEVIRANEKRRTFRDRTYKQTGRTELRSDLIYSLDMYCPISYGAWQLFSLISQILLRLLGLKPDIQISSRGPSAHSPRPQEYRFPQPGLIILLFPGFVKRPG